MVADITTLENYYGQDFHKNAIPKTADVEQIEKDKLLSSLKSATRKTQKGEYHKIRHGHGILKQLNADKVRSAARHCELLFATLERIIDS